MSDRFHHLFIPAADFERSLVFYRDVLGWDVTRSWGEDGGERGVILTGGGTKVVIVQRPNGANPTDYPIVVLDIHDLDTRFRKLPKGMHVVTPPEDTRWGTRWFVVRDPDGHLIAFEEIHLGGR